MVSEQGASIYSASKIARDEFPDLTDESGLPEYPIPDRTTIVAFPGAYGAGKYTTGGAGGIFKVGIAQLYFTFDQFAIRIADKQFIFTASHIERAIGNTQFYPRYDPFINT